MARPIAWVTGAGSGFGRAVALRLVADGYAVAATARSQSDLDQLAAEPLARDAIKAFPGDVTDRVAMAAIADAIENQIGPIDLVFLSAGGYLPFPIEQFSAEKTMQTMTLNVGGVANVLEAVIPRFLQRKKGHIAVVSSVAGYRGLPQAAAYGPTKAALINLCEALKPDLDPYGVRISVINPGFVRTPLTDLNPFPMPFLMEADAVADRIVKGLARGAFEITFPRRFTWSCPSVFRSIRSRAWATWSTCTAGRWSP